MDTASLLERLTAHRTIGGVPREELEWLVANGSLRTIEPAGILTPKTGPVAGLYVVLDGHLSIRVDRGAGPHVVMEWRGGDVTGVLPYSRIGKPPGDVVADERATILMIDAALVPRLIRECPELTAVLVHVMLDRARVFKSSELLDEKMASLGRLAAGLAHELNNPASAVARSAKTLVSQLTALDDANQRYCALKLTEAQRRAAGRLRDERRQVRDTLTPLELTDRQDAIDDWLAAHDVRGVDVSVLANAGIQPGDLDSLGPLDGSTLGVVIAHVSTGLTVRQLGDEIDTAASRIHSLVDAVKGFTYVNQQATLQPIAIGRGLSDTVTVLRSKAKAKSVDIQIRVPENLPAVDGYGGELT
jgi:signal transduction histidine kinase